VERQRAADGDDLVVGMRRDDEDALLFHGAQLHWRAVRDAVDAPQEARGRALEDAVEECRPLHESTSSATYVSRRYISNPPWCASCPAQTSICRKCAGRRRSARPAE